MLRNFRGSTGARAVIAVLMLLFVVACAGSDSGIKRERDEARAAAEAAEQARLAAEAAAAAAAEQAKKDAEAAAAAAEEARLAAEAAAAEQAKKDAEAAAAAAAEQAEMDRLAMIEEAKQAIAAATTAAGAQAAKDAVNDIATALEAVALQAAVDARTAELATMANANAQRIALMTAADAIDTSDLMDAAAIAAANAAIAALEAAITAAVDVDDTSMYQGLVDAAKTAVATAQSTLDHAAQTAALTSAVTALQAIDLTDLSTQAAIDAANAAIAEVRAALDAATELSAAEKTMAMTELGTADRTVMMAQDRFDTAAQTTALNEAVATLAALDLDNLMTQEQIDEALGAITALNLALAAATNLTDAEKLDATVDVTVAQRKVDRAETTLTENVGNQRTALMTAGATLAAIDLDDLDTQAKIDAADTAVTALEMALAAATHLSDSEKATYQMQLNTATETVRTAKTGMDRNDRMMAQRTAITNAVTMARTAVAGVNDDSTDTEVGAADAAIAVLKAAIEGAVDLPAGDADVASAQGTLTTLEGQLTSAKTSRTAYLETKADDDMEVAAKLGKDMRKALGGTDTEGSTALDNVTTAALDTSDRLTITIAANAGDLTIAAGALPRLNPSDSAESLGSWARKDYALTTGTGSSKVTREARVYTNQGNAVPGMAFNSKYTLLPAGQTDPKNNGRVQVAQGTTPVSRIKADAFTHSGTQTHSRQGNDDAVYVNGSYDGVLGEFRCASDTCSSTNDGKSSPSALVGDWYFKPANPLEKVSAPDDNYLYYGWWVQKDDEGIPKAASAFAGIVGDVDGTGDTAAGSALTGSATYAGHAVGKFAMSNALDGTGNGGHFTADATLTAKFGANPVAGSEPDVGQGITGTIDNFRLNDGSEDPNWSVSLRRRGWAAAGAIGDALDNPDTATVNESTGGSTVWSINDNSATASGTWTGQMHDELPGNTDDTPPGDGNTVPTTVTGTFYSEFSNIGRMVGAFGAEKQ